VAQVQTVTGELDPSTLGFTLPHEHTACALWHTPGRWDYWELTAEEDVLASEVAAFQATGGTCLVDVTPVGIGRDPGWLVRLSRRTELPIVMGAGWYRGAYYPPEARIDRRSVDDLADELVREVEEGVDGTGVRPGILGEIGTDKPWVSALEERVFRAVGRAAVRTGLAVTTHAVMSDVGLAQLRILEDEGVDPSRVVIGHADSYPSLAYHLAVIERGANVEFDFIGMSFTPMERKGEPRILDLVGELVAHGHADRLLLSQDVCHNQQLRHYEGHGYAYLAETFLPRLREAGVGDDTIRQITIENPRRILTIG
jgi:predicted metal-dependent phosphotriesterase family hydrolase